MEDSIQRQNQIAQLLQSWQKGDRDAYDHIIGLLFEDLKEIAHRQLKRERAEHTMQTGDLVNQLYLKLFRSKTIPWSDRHHFLMSAARGMRQILIDHSRGWQRRHKDKVPFEDELSDHSGAQKEHRQIEQMLALNETIQKLERLDLEMAKIAEFRLTFGLTLAETAVLVDQPVHKVKRQWQVIRKFLGKAI